MKELDDLHKDLSNFPKSLTVKAKNAFRKKIPQKERHGSSFTGHVKDRNAEILQEIKVLLVILRVRPIVNFWSQKKLVTSIKQREIWKKHSKAEIDNAKISAKSSGTERYYHHVGVCI